MREEIISLLSQKETMSLEIDAIAKKLMIKNKSILQEELTNLVRDGILDYSSKKNKYLLFENSHLVKVNLGPLDKLGNGTAEVNGKKISILKRNLKGATYNDLVALDIDDSNNYGIVTRIIKRDANNYIGEVISKNNRLFIKDKRLGLIDLKYNVNFVEGQKVLIRHENGENRIVKVIGHKDDPGIDIKSILYDHGFSDELNPDVLSELEKIPTELTIEEIKKELSRGRVDHRDRNIVTMDCDDTKDIDDAISVKKFKNGGFELSVYIADVSHYVKEGSAIDEDAYKRGTSVYPPGSVEPMLDHKLSNGICSLNPNTDRLALAYTTIFDKFGKPIDFKVEKAIINSKKKMTYSAVNDILEKEEIREDYQEYLKDIYIMYELSLLIYNQFLNSGYLNFISTESEVVLNEDGVPIEIKNRDTGVAQKIIEMFMLTTNIELTKWAYYLNLPWVYRIHGEPSQERLLSTYKVLNYKKYLNMKEKKNYTRKDIQKTIELLKEKEASHIFSRMFITSQDKAKYSDENIGHYAIAALLYSHDTSPIRRYPDLQNQRIIKSFLEHGLEYTQGKYDNLKEVAIHCSAMEREAASVEREATDMKKAEYMENHIGETYTGYISYVSRFGFWVVLDNTIEGFVHISNLPKDNYKYSEDIISLIGRANTFSIGDKVEVKVKEVSKEARTVDFGLVKKYELEEKDSKTNHKTKKLIK